MYINKKKERVELMSSTSNYKPESIFYSDQQDQNFQIMKTNEPDDKNCLDDLINELLVQRKPIQINQESRPSLRPRGKLNLYKSSCSELQQSSKMILNYHTLQDEDGNTFSPVLIKERPVKITNKIRISDQNVCKKYHGIANRCLKNMNLYHHMIPYAHQIHKKNYFIYVLVLVQKANKLENFIQIYEEYATECAFECKRIFSHTFAGNRQYKKNKTLLKALLCSLDALSIFETGNIQQALQCLFDKTKMKRISRIKEAMQEVIQFGLKTKLI